MKIGDLVCYNAGGMKRKSLGMVLDTAWFNGSSSQKPCRLVRIVWIKKPSMPPSPQGYHPKSGLWTGSSHIYDKMDNWYKKGDWFEIIKKV